MTKALYKYFPILRVRQQDQYGCVIACCAMIRGVSYEEVREELGEPTRGFNKDVWEEYLSRHGFAIQFHYRYDCVAKKERDIWPMLPWSSVHICCVDAGHGDGTHVVIMLEDGSVIDPASDSHRHIVDYSKVSYMAAIYRIGP